MNDEPELTFNTARQIPRASIDAIISEKDLLSRIASETDFQPGGISPIQRHWPLKLAAIAASIVLIATGFQLAATNSPRYSAIKTQVLCWEQRSSTFVKSSAPFAHSAALGCHFDSGNDTAIGRRVVACINLDGRAVVVSFANRRGSCKDVSLPPLSIHHRQPNSRQIQNAVQSLNLHSYCPDSESIRNSVAKQLGSMGAITWRIESTPKEACGTLVFEASRHRIMIGSARI